MIRIAWHVTLAPFLVALACLPVLSGCRSTAVGSPTPHAGQAELLQAGSGNTVTLEEAAQAALLCDVIFLGELHDNDAGHAFYAALSNRILELAEEQGRPVTLAMEMFERDTQDLLDGYLAGQLSEEEFLAQARPWPNYKDHYRPLVEQFRAAGRPVLAANIPRRVASRIGREGLEAGRASVFAAHAVHTGPGEYKRRFFETMAAMAGHGAGMPVTSLERMFAAQASKDDTMAESIAEHLQQAGDPLPLVLVACGRFHSDYGLGTAERLRARLPELDLLVFSMSPRADAQAELAEQPPAGRYILAVD
jgi:uncharacterized iron-regulated protein